MDWMQEDDFFAASVNGIDATIRKFEYESGGTSWFWSVQASATRVECPEVWNTGRTRTLAKAKSDAEVSARKADRAYPHRPECGYW